MKSVSIDYFLSDWTHEGDATLCPSCSNLGNVWAWGDDYYLGSKYVCTVCSHSFHYTPGSDEPEVASMIKTAIQKGDTNGQTQ